MALPSIEKALKHPSVSGRGVLHLVVLDPELSLHQCGFDEALLYEHSIGDALHWEVDHAAFAKDKALVSWQHQMDSRRAVLLRHYWLTQNETMLWGGVWLDGIVVAASGAMPAWDEAFSLMVASNLRAIRLQEAWAQPMADTSAKARRPPE